MKISGLKTVGNFIFSFELFAGIFLKTNCSRIRVNWANFNGDFEFWNMRGENASYWCSKSYWGKELTDKSIHKGIQ